MTEPGTGAGDVCTWQPLADGRALQVVIREHRADRGSDLDSRVASAWERIREKNPRAFNGPILSYTGSNAAKNRVECERDEYRRLAVTPEVDTGVVQLGVTGILEARDSVGEPHVLMGLRSHATRIFGGMWELGPSGGVDPPPVGQAVMDADDIWRVLINEIREEVGLPVDPDPAPPIGLLHDPVGHSCELVVRVTLRRPVEELVALTDVQNGTSRWEYDAVRWIPVRALPEFVERMPAIPSAVALAPRLTA